VVSDADGRKVSWKEKYTSFFSFDRARKRSTVFLCFSLVAGEGLALYLNQSFFITRLLIPDTQSKPNRLTLSVERLGVASSV
jgi:hypothetical protein